MSSRLYALVDSRQVLLLPFVMGCFLSGSVYGEWLPAERYQGMNVMERRQFDRGLSLYQKKEYAAAAAEFEKFKVQFPNATALPYVILHQGLSLHGGNYRHKAIRVYQEVLDYFGTDPDPAAKALFQIGKAYEDNGDRRRSLEAMNRLADHKEWKKHPLAAGAIRRLADLHVEKKQTESALRRWRQVYADFQESNEKEAVYCRDRLANHLLSQGQFEGFAEWLTVSVPLDEESENPELTRKLWIADYAFTLCWAGFRKNGWKLDDSGGGRTALVKRFYAFYGDFGDAYGTAGRSWEYFKNCIRFTAEIMNSKRELQLVIDDASDWLIAVNGKAGPSWSFHDRMIWINLNYVKTTDGIGKAVDDALAYLGEGHKKSWANYQKLIKQLLKQLGDHAGARKALAAGAAHVAELGQTTDRDAGYVWLSDTLKEAGFVDQALLRLDTVSHVALRKFKAYEIVGGKQGHWKEAVELLMQVEQTGDRTLAPKAREARAGIYKNQLKEYAQAISLYHEIDDPPRTLWEIQDCYWRWEKTEKTYTTLREIEAMFPPSASAAAWKRTECLKSKGKKEVAIAEARRILKIYPKSKESSKAHQLLESYGIATGGGLDD